MRLLVSSSEAPLPPLGGLGHPLRELLLRLRHRHDVDLLSYLGPDQDEMPIAGVRTTYMRAPTNGRVSRGTSFVRASIAGKPLRAAELTEPMRQQVRAAVQGRDFDAVQVWGLPLATLASVVKPVPNALVVLDAWHLNAEAEVGSAPLLARSLKRIARHSTVRFERSHLHRFDRVVTVTDRDALALTSLDPAIKPVVIPNGVDADHFAPGPELREKRLIVFVGTMSFAPNIQAVTYMAQHVLPTVLASFPDARFAVVGRGLSDSLKAEWQALPGMSVIGEVADVRPWLRRAHVVVCPMVSGTGIKNKLLEALATGVPCVTTTLACQGTKLIDGHHVMISDRAADFARRIGEVFMDDQLAERLAASGRSYVLAEHSWDQVSNEFEQMHTKISEERQLVSPTSG